MYPGISIDNKCIKIQKDWWRKVKQTSIAMGGEVEQLWLKEVKKLKEMYKPI